MKVNPNNLKPSVKMLLEEYCYNAATLSNDTFVYDNKVIASVKELELTQDPKYKTAFYNESLYNAVIPRNSRTAIHLYDESGNEIKSAAFTLGRDYGSIVFDREPSTIPVKCTAVIYKGIEADSVLATDGSNTMNEEYTPTKSQSVVTKGYLESEIDSLQAGLYTLNSLTIKQAGKPLPELLQYSTSEKLPVLFCTDTVGALTVQTNSFVIEHSWGEDETSIELVVDGTSFLNTKVKDVMDGKSPYWSLSTSKNVFETDYSNTYWLNSYILNLKNVSLLAYLVDIKVASPSVVLAVRVKCGSREYAASSTIGIDKYSNAKENPIISWSDANLQTLKKHYVSGIRYFESKEDIYKLKVTFTHDNLFLHYYRPELFTEMGVIYDGKYEKQIEEGLDSHIPNDTYTTYEHSVNIDLRVGVTGIYFKVFDALGNQIGCVTKDIDCSFNSGVEKYRVNTPSASNAMPDESSLTEWDSEKTLESFEPSLIDDTYVLLNKEDKDLSAICFKYEPSDKEHYSHIDVDVEHDGQMCIKSAKMTNWLDCQKYVQPFDTPTKFKDACKLGEGNSYTFGKVVYNTPVFIRIVGATSIKLNSITLR